MPPLPSEQALYAPLRLASGRSAAERRAGEASTDWRTLLLVLSVFWCYVAISNVLYAHTMQATLINHPHFFATWWPRILQHVFLYPVLLVCVWISLRVGWQKAWLAVPMQIGLGLLFSVAAKPALVLSEELSGTDSSMSDMMQDKWSPMTDLVSGWIASATSFLLTYGFGLALITGLVWYQRYRDSQLRFTTLERSLAATRLSALRMQLSPHTLFNLLHTIRGQISWDPVSAQTMVVQLSDVLRRLLAAGERDFSRLGDEFEFVRLYLELQRSRFSDRLSVQLSVLEELSSLWVPSLILQPLVENAVAHGLAGHAGPVEIRVEAHAAQEALRLRVVNSMAAGASSGNFGIGLRNVRERLRLHFGDAATLKAAASDQGSWISEIYLPLVRDVGAGVRGTH